MICKDPFTKFLNDLGYAPLKLATSGSLLGVLLAKVDGKWRRIGTVKDLAHCPDNGIDRLLRSPNEGIHPEVSGYLTDKVGLDIAAPILNRVFQASIGMIIKGTDKVSFGFGTVTSRGVDYLPASTALKACKAKSRDIKKLFFVSGELRAREINISFYHSQGNAVKITGELLKILKAKTSPDFELDIGWHEDTVLAVRHKGESLIFAVAAFMLKVEDNGTIKPEFDFLEEPVRARAMASVRRIERESFLRAVGRQTLLSIE